MPVKPARRERGAARAQLVAAATQIFNESGYDATDSNAIARAAGYAPATFYRYFADKLELFLEIYGDVVRDEWDEVDRLAATERATPGHALARHLLRYHRHWRVFRLSLRRLVLSDDAVRDAFWKRRGRQVDRAVALFAQDGARLDRKNAGALIVIMAALADAAADGELKRYGFTAAETELLLVDLGRALIARAGTRHREPK